MNSPSARENPQNEVRTSVYELAGLLVGVMALLVVLALATVFAQEYGTSWFSLFALALLLSIPVLLAVARGRFDPFEPIYIVNTAYFLYLVYAPAKDLVAGQEYFFGRQVLPLLPRASLYAGLGIAAMTAAYYLRTSHTSPSMRPRPDLDRARLVKFAILIAAVGVAAFSAWLAQNGMAWMRFLTLGQMAGAPTGMMVAETGATNYYLVSVDLLMPAFILLYAALEKRRIWLIPAFLVPFLVYTTFGFRYRLLILVLAPVIYRFLQKRRRPNMIHLAVAAAIAIPAIGLIGSTRTSFREGKEVSREQIEEAEAIKGFQGDLAIYQPWLAMIDAIPLEQDYFWGESFTYLLVHPIPRALWPGKPESPVYGIIRAAFRGDNAAVISGVAYPNFAEFYANFGVPGIIFGMALFGYALAALRDFLQRNRQSALAVATFAITLPFLVQVVSRGYLVAIFQQFIFIIGPLILIRYLSGPQSKPQHASSMAPMPPSVRRAHRTA